jgi:hypothetical protein
MMVANDEMSKRIGEREPSSSAWLACHCTRVQVSLHWGRKMALKDGAENDRNQPVRAQKLVVL